MSATRADDRAFTGFAGLLLAMSSASDSFGRAAARYRRSRTARGHCRAADASADPILEGDARGTRPLEVAAQNGQRSGAVLHRVPTVRCRTSTTRKRHLARCDRISACTRAVCESSCASATTSRTATTVPGVGVVTFAPLDNDSIALRRQLWTATDRRLQEQRARRWR